MAVLQEAKALAIPSKQEQARIDSLVSEVLKKVSSEIKKQKISAKIIVGGSVAKGTWLPGISDIDFFMIFNYERYSDKSAELSDIAEKALAKAFPRLKRLHGSRDYFSAKHKGYSLEFVPVLDISKGQQARNITDYSPLHINWIMKKAKRKDDIRIAKQFLKAAGVYGAESYISGFSGHVADLLVSHYGNFGKFVKSAASWKLGTFIDPARKYKDKKDALSVLNAAKIKGPLILIDPIESERNAAAALEKEKFETFTKVCKNFIKKYSVEFFREKHITTESLIARKNKRVLIVFEVRAPQDKPDIIGARMRTLFENLQKRFASEDFVVKEKGWHFDATTRFWFYFDKKPLSGKKLHFGPPAKLAKEHIDGFKKAWKGHKISIKNKRYIVELKRKYTTPKDFAKSLAKEFKIKLIHNC